MRPQRTVRAAVLLAVVSVLAPVLAGCSPSSSGSSASGSSASGSSSGSSPSGSVPGTPGRQQAPPVSGPGQTAGGRTTATYRATGPGGSVPGAAEVGRTADRLRARLAAFGLTGATVEVSGRTLTVTAPGDATGALRQVAVPADLVFRPVLAATVLPAETQHAYRTLDCTASGEVPAPAAPDRPTAACDRKLHQKYALGPAGVTGADIREATAVRDTAGGAGWMVDLGFTSAGSAKFARVTGALATQAPPANQFAILLDGEVLSAPAVQQAITGGEAQISGNFTAESAARLAALITSGVLPVRLTADSVTRVP